MRAWYQKLTLKLLHSVAKALEIKPFLQVDPHEYCLACGDRSVKKINAVALTQSDREGSKIAIQITCGVCSFRWLVSSVTIIKQHLLETSESEEEQNLREMKADKRTRNVRTTKIKVNGVEVG